MATVRRAILEDVPAIGDALNRALVDDPFVRWLVSPNAPAAGRRAYVRLMLEKIALPRGIVDAAFVEDRVAGAALWAPPGTFDLGLVDTIFMLPWLVRAVGLTRLLGVADALASVDAARPAEPRWLLTLIGTLPDHRRRGIGAALLSHGVERCDEHGAPAVLETAHEPNLTFYERFGFEVTSKRTLLPDGPPSWTLVRRAGGS